MSADDLPSDYKLKCEARLTAQYRGWESLLYPKGRTVTPALLKVEFTDEDSRYAIAENVIVISVGEWNAEELLARDGDLILIPDRIKLLEPEIALLHEMMHERQYKHTHGATCAGRALMEAHQPKFPGPGHDEVFYTAVAESAPCLGVEPEQLLANI